MDYAKFQVAVIEVASEGTPLTVANVVAHLRVTPAEASRHLDRMTREQLADLDVDENDGVVVYRVRGLSTKRSSSKGKLESLRAEVERAAASSAIERVAGAGIAKGLLNVTRGGGGAPLPESQRRSLAVGGALGFFLPGFGLLYSAPWPVAIVSGIAFAIAFKLLMILPFIGAPILGILALLSGAAGALYTMRFNQTGKRTPLLPPEPEKRKLENNRLRF